MRTGPEAIGIEPVTMTRSMGVIREVSSMVVRQVEPLAGFCRSPGLIRATPIDAFTSPTYLPVSKRFDVAHRIDSMNGA
jgi:hypothetical protein